MTRDDQGPHFLGIGAARSGTTWIDSVLSNESRVWIPRRKELHYLSRDSKYPSPSWIAAPGFVGRLFGDRRFAVELIRAFGSDLLHGALAEARWDARYFFGRHDQGYAFYQSLFEGRAGKLTGEITPAYALLDDADVARLAEALPALKIIYIMREPVDRAWSTIRYHETRTGNALTSMPTEEIKAYLSQAGIVERSRYSDVIDRWRHFFGESRVFLACYDEILEKPADLVARLLAFLGLPVDDAETLSEADVVNASLPRGMPPEIQRFLIERFTPEVEKLAGRIDGYPQAWLARYRDLADR